MRDASRANLQKLLREGYSVALCPGGIWEQVNADHREEKCYCQRGLGFIRLAMEAGDIGRYREIWGDIGAVGSPWRRGRGSNPNPSANP